MLSRACQRLAAAPWRRLCVASEARGGGEREAMVELRRRTGYSFINCRRALRACDGDTSAAERWLNEQALQEGWARGARLKERRAREGLVAALTAGDCGVLVEVNCETDFVARNDVFRELVGATARAALDVARRSPPERALIDVDALMPLNEGDLSERLAMALSRLGEKLAVRRALRLTVGADALVVGYAHPRNADSPSDEGPFVGQYASLVAFERAEAGAASSQVLGQQLCQHIVGMNPLSLGEPPSDAHVEPPAHHETAPVAQEEEVDGEDESESEDEGSTRMNESTELLRQDFLLSPDFLVADFTRVNGLRLVDFARFQCGEQLDE